MLKQIIDMEFKTVGDIVISRSLQMFQPTRCAAQ